MWRRLLNSVVLATATHKGIGIATVLPNDLKKKKKGEEEEENKNLEPWWRKLKFWLHLKFSSLVLYLKTSGSLKLSKKIGVMRYCKL